LAVSIPLFLAPNYAVLKWQPNKPPVHDTVLCSDENFHHSQAYGANNLSLTDSVLCYGPAFYKKKNLKILV
jgi:hypothetical protein